MTHGPFTTDEQIEIAREGLVRAGTIATFALWKEQYGSAWAKRAGAWCFDARGRRCYDDTQAHRAAWQGAYPLTYYVCPPRPDHVPPAVVGGAVVNAARRLGLVDERTGPGTVQVALLLEELEHRAARGDALRYHITQLANEESNGNGQASAHQLRQALAAGPLTIAPHSITAELFALTEGVLAGARALGLEARGRNPRAVLDAIVALARLGFQSAPTRS